MKLVAGVDEVGRGCLAGPVIAAAVILTNNIPGLKDSKKLSKKKREELSLTIMKTLCPLPQVPPNSQYQDHIKKIQIISETDRSEHNNPYEKINLRQLSFHNIRNAHHTKLDWKNYG